LKEGGNIYLNMYVIIKSASPKRFKPGNKWSGGGWGQVGLNIWQRQVIYNLITGKFIC
jgi:hypothetical protein